VSLLHSLMLVGAISPVEAPPAASETSPTPGSAPPALETAEPETTPSEPETTPPEPETTPPEPETTPPEPETTTVEATPPATPETPPPAGPPGGYWTLAEQRESREPLDGEDELTIGSVLFSLGALRAGAGVLTIFMAVNPEQCPLTEPRGCSGLRNYGWVGVAEGGLMFGTGLTYLAIGAARRQRHRQWKRGEISQRFRSGENIVDVGPWLIPRAAGGVSQAGVLAGAGLRLQLQF
jgi:hypothetical protein